MKVRIDEDKCCGYAACLSAAEDLFDLGDDNIAVVLVTEPAPDRHAAAREAASACPTDAIVIEE
jgi:ferredoxin